MSDRSKGWPSSYNGLTLVRVIRYDVLNLAHALAVPAYLNIRKSARQKGAHEMRRHF